ncbi:glycosyltransferase family 4 protein [Metabacillus herbersteinensis]|uniref:Glycosyltransferase family 4 protein n=1 Tax=Metabacillus herbersteinensis TaxID=283816 RepID=A0ABV6GF26_9BACI
MKKVLFVATVVKMHIEVFHISYLKWFKDNGYEVHVCAKNDYEKKENCDIPYCDRYFDLPFERSPLNFKNISVYKQLQNIIESNDYEIIHCHTPMGGALTRLAAIKARRKGMKIIYTAHGFHFFKGAPIKNWLIFYPVERWLSRYTDILITINKEDYDMASRFNAKKMAYVPGVGIDVKKFEKGNVDREKKRNEIGIRNEAVALLSVGELSKRKNHEVVIRALARINNPNIIYFICGQGDLDGYLQKISKELNVDVRFLGFRKDIFEICAATDIFVFPSYQEGLPVALMEAMSAGLAVVCSRIRGNTDLIENGAGGYLVDPGDIDGFKEKIETLVNNKQMCIDMGDHNIKVVKEYDKEVVNKKMENIYLRM